VIPGLSTTVQIALGNDGEHELPSTGRRLRGDEEERFCAAFNWNRANRLAFGSATLACLPTAHSVRGNYCSAADGLEDAVAIEYSVVVHSPVDSGTDMADVAAAAHAAVVGDMAACVGAGAYDAHLDRELDRWNATAAFDVETDRTLSELASSTSDGGSFDEVVVSECEDEEMVDDDDDEMRDVAARWDQMGANLEGTKTNERFGGAVAISSTGKTLVAGGPSANRAGTGEDAGVVRIYDYGAGCCSEELSWREVPVWEDVATFTNVAGDEQPFVAADRLGEAVAVSGHGRIVAVGAPGYNNDQGLVLVLRYKKNAAKWVQMGNALYGWTQNVGDDFGGSLALNDAGDLLVVGAPGASGVAGDTAVGAVRAYRSGYGGWFPVAEPVYGERARDGLGWAVALDSTGETLVASAPNADLDGDPDAGLVRVWRLNANYGWVRKGDDIHVEERGDRQEAANAEFGFAVSVSGDGQRVAVGAPGLRDDRGKVRVYAWNAGGKNWRKLGTDLGGTCGGKGVERGDCVAQRMGEAVKLSKSGVNLLVASPTANAEFDCASRFDAPRCDPDHDDYDGTYGETNVGLVRAYRYNATAGDWETSGRSMFGSTKSGYFGKAVDFTDNADVAVVGAPHVMVSGVGTSAGLVRVFRDESTCRKAGKCDADCDPGC